MPSADMVVRLFVGGAVAGGIALVAERARSLDRSGAIAATVVGTAAAVASWNAGILLVVYFVTSSLLSHFRRREKEIFTQGVVEKSGKRDAMQVIANGGAFATFMVIAAFAPGVVGETISGAAIGALAASAADTWATETGILFGGAPRSVRTFKTVARGTSGAVSTAGSLGMVSGAVVVSMVAVVLGLANHVWPLAVAGVAGALVDTLLGASLQERRWCETCEVASEQRVHDCGRETRLTGGREWMNNDVVNLLATIAGAAVAALLSTV